MTDSHWPCHPPQFPRLFLQLSICWEMCLEPEWVLLYLIPVFSLKGGPYKGFFLDQVDKLWKVACVSSCFPLSLFFFFFLFSLPNSFPVFSKKIMKTKTFVRYCRHLISHSTCDLQSSRNLFIMHLDKLYAQCARETEEGDRFHIGC